MSDSLSPVFLFYIYIHQIRAATGRIVGRGEFLRKAYGSATGVDTIRLGHNRNMRTVGYMSLIVPSVRGHQFPGWRYTKYVFNHFLAPVHQRG